MDLGGLPSKLLDLGRSGEAMPAAIFTGLDAELASPERSRHYRRRGTKSHGAEDGQTHQSHSHHTERNGPESPKHKRRSSSRNLTSHTDSTTTAANAALVSRLDSLERGREEHLQREERLLSRLEECERRLRDYELKETKTKSGSDDPTTVKAQVIAAPGGGDTIEQSFQLSGSAWEVPLILGLTPLGVGASAVGCVLLILNVLIQLIFTSITMTSLTDPAFDDDDISSLRKWRRSVAHHIKYMDPISKTSLGERVCDGDSGLEISQGQSAAYQDLDDYLEDYSPFGGMSNSPISVGPMMCVLAIVCWSMSVFKELNAALSFIISVLQLPRGTATVMEITAEECKIASISKTRLGSLLVIQLVRMMVAGIMMWAGYLFIVNTLPIGDLLLNAVALEFVLSIDELIFECLAPARLAKMVDSLAPLPMKPLQLSLGGLDRRALLTYCSLSAILLLSVPFLLIGSVDKLITAKDALCGGEVAWVYSVGGMGVPGWARTAQDSPKPEKPWNTDWNGMRLNADVQFTAGALDMVLQGYGHGHGPTSCGPCENETTNTRLDDAPMCCLAQQTWVPEVDDGRFSVEHMNTETEDEASQLYNPGCEDSIDVPLSYQNLLQGSVSDAVGFDGCDDGCPTSQPLCIGGECMAANCTTMHRFCYDASNAGVRARQMCPITCGCAAPCSHLVLKTPADGCPSSCVDYFDYQSQLNALTCQDRPRADPELREWVSEFIRAADSFPYTWGSGARDVFGPLLHDYGCYVIPFLWEQKLDFCEDGGTFFPVNGLKAFCPTTCGCTSADNLCPDACRATARRTVTAPMDTFVEIMSRLSTYAVLSGGVGTGNDGSARLLEMWGEYHANATTDTDSGGDLEAGSGAAVCADNAAFQIVHPSQGTITCAVVAAGVAAGLAPCGDCSGEFAILCAACAAACGQC